MAANTTPKVPRELSDALRQNKCAVLVGAGLSQGAGFPGWKGLLDQLIQEAIESEGLTKSRVAELEAMLERPDRYLTLAEELYDVFGRDELKKRIGAIFLDEKIQPTASHKAIAALPFSLAITTNYDHLLEIGYARSNQGRRPPTYTYNEATDFADALWSQRFFLLKAHGDAERSTSLILSGKDYRKLVRGAPGYRALMSAIFTTRTVLFVGASLDDPEINLLLEYLHDSFHGGGQRHFALVPSDSFSKTLSNRWLRDYRVECLRYVPSPNHPEVARFLKTLGSQAKSAN